MRFFQLLCGLGVIVLFGLAGCGGEVPLAPPTTAPPTEAPANSMVTSSQQATAEAPPTMPPPTVTIEAAAATPIPTSTPLPTDTPAAPTSTPTPTEPPEPVVRLNDKATSQINVRGGPGTDYPIVGSFGPDQIAVVIGRNANSSWWRIRLEGAPEPGWVYARLVVLRGSTEDIAVAEAPPLPTAEPVEAVAEAATTESTPTADAPAEPPAPEQSPAAESSTKTGEASTPEELADSLRCGKDFCVTYQAMVPIWENGGCIGNHSIYVTVLEGPPPGRPLDGIVLGDTFGNVEIASGSKGPGAAEFTLWMNSMSIKVKRHIDGREFTSEESYSFTSHDELIPAEVLAANGYCDGSVETCRIAQNQNQVCRGHYSWRVTFHKFD